MKRVSWRAPQELLERADALRAKRDLALRVHNSPTVETCERELRELREELGRVLTRPLFPELEPEWQGRRSPGPQQARPGECREGQK